MVRRNKSQVVAPVEQSEDEHKTVSKAAYVAGVVTNKAAKEALTPEERKAQKKRLKHLAQIKKAENKRKKKKHLFKKSEQLPVDTYSGSQVLRNDRCAQDVLGYDLLFEEGIVRVQEGAYTRVLEFDDTSFQAARDDEQNEIFDSWRELLSSYDDTTHLQIKILCRVVDKVEFLEQTSLKAVEGDNKGNLFRDEINQIIEQKLKETKQNVVRKRLLLITVEAPTKDDALPLLVREVDKAQQQFRNMGVTSHVLSGDELLQTINTITNPDDTRNVVSFDDLKTTNNTTNKKAAFQLGYTTKDLIAPANIKIIDNKHVAWSNKVGQSLYIQKWANSIRTNMLSDLAELPINQLSRLI